MVQSAVELRPRLSPHNPQPIVCGFAPCHPNFRSVRWRVLLDHSLWVVCRDLLHNVAATRLQQSLSYGAMRAANSFISCSEAAFSKVLQLLTLTLHMIFEEVPVPNHGDVEEDCGEQLSTTEMKKRFAAIVVEIPEPISVKQVSTDGVALANALFQHPSLLDTLLDLHSNFLSSVSSSQTALDANNACWLK